jgi:dihydropyrimidinase
MEGEKPCSGEELQGLLKRKEGAFRFIPNGIPGVETRLPLLYTGALASGRITPQRFVELTSKNPAKLVIICLLLLCLFKLILTYPQYGLYPKKGALMPGSDADFVIVRYIHRNRSAIPILTFYNSSGTQRRHFHHLTSLILCYITM